VSTVKTVIDQWILDDEGELEARCARFRLALMELTRPDPKSRQDDEPEPT
jgi:hypothetical protein